MSGILRMLWYAPPAVVGVGSAAWVRERLHLRKEDAMSVWQSRAQMDITDRLHRPMLIRTRLSLSHLASSIHIE